MALIPEQRELWDREKATTLIDKKSKQVSPSMVVILSLCILACLIIAGISSPKNNPTTPDLPNMSDSEKETQYQQGIELIKQQKWDDVAINLVLLKEANYKESKVLYAYAMARRDSEGNALTGTWDRVCFYCKDIPDNYKNVFSDEIIAFKKDSLRKQDMLDKATEQ